MADKEKFFKCSCHSEGMLVTKFDDEEELCISFWREGINPVKLSFWMRLKLCYLSLFKGNYYDDQLILNKETTEELFEWLKDRVNEEKMLQRTRELNSTIRPRKY